MKKIISVFCLLCVIFTVGCSPTASIVVEDQGLPSGALRKTKLYYANDAGLILPVVREIPWDDGIACAALSYLVGTEDNIREAATHGLRTVIPEGTEFSLRIDEKKTAKLDVKNLPTLPDGESERIFLQTVVNTLTAFDTIDCVSITFNGEKLAALPHHTRINSEMNTYLLNPVNTEAETIAQGSISTAILYVPDCTCRYSLPLTCYVTGKADFEAAMKKFCSCSEEFGTALPQGTDILSAALTEKTAVVNFSDEFSDVLTYGDGVYEAVYRAVYLTACEYGDIDTVRIFSGGTAMPDVQAANCSNIW